MKSARNQIVSLLTAILLGLCACGAAEGGQPEKAAETANEQTEQPAEEQPQAALPHSGDVMILYTSDVHCGIDEGFGYAGLQQVREELEAQGYTVLLVDNGDAVQGAPIGTLTKGAAMIDLMNEMHYDVAISGNHEFDYGMEQFLANAEQAEFPYVSCNFNKEGTLVFPPYVILEAAGKRIAFIGVTTPVTITTSTPRYFQNENGEYVYDFFQDETGEKLYEAVQDAVDAAKAEGADYIYVLGHLGMSDAANPWTYADVIAHTSGIDVFLDGHSHDTEQVVMKDRDGREVTRSACGTKMECIGYSCISADKGITETGIWSWPNTNTVSAPSLLGIHNKISEKVAAAEKNLDSKLQEVVAVAAVDLTIYDPEEVDNSGNRVRMIRRAETNLGDLCADAYRAAADADIGVACGGGIRAEIPAGEVTYEKIINVFPFGNELVVVEVTGQQIMDALEWSVHRVPAEFGGFLQVSGLSFDVDVSVESTCTADDHNMFTGVTGARRVSNVMVGEEPIDPDRKYTVAGQNYTLLNHGDGHTAFDGAVVLQNGSQLDNQLLIDYIASTFTDGGGAAYTDLYGQGRIRIAGE